MSWLKGGSLSKTVEILTIWGMAGIEKTTLAKYIYRLHSHEFERISFVEDIERKCADQTHALLNPQKQLLGDILRKRMIEEHNVDVCTSKIKKVLFHKQTLVVLDGVDNFEQIDALIGTKGFQPGSKIIVTTKDRSITENCALFRLTMPPKHTKHALCGLSASESLRLFCWHAFGGYDPKEGYKKEAITALKYCGGHPLALKVLGSSLSKEDVATWTDTFEMLETREFHTHVNKVLQISFDSLPSENCKDLFKHIACLVLDMKILEKEPLLALKRVVVPEFEDDDPNTIFGIGSYKNFPNTLIGLCLHGFQLKYIPSELPMEKLVALYMSYSGLTELWKKPKILRPLKILNLSYCKLVRVGGFSRLPALERLILTRCECLVHVCDLIGECGNLLLLDMRYCKKLKNLPSSISKLKNVRTA
ncbi:unnamed protein product [Lactuca saligna]|uniref:NB-ARC domain-containing protein n=1 Tax=Lactuca saligna TaxID=75948 RepID=A0AA35ZW62_LACSI|nr:unnamed protein product [Lactuca saligna]